MKGFSSCPNENSASVSRTRRCIDALISGAREGVRRDGDDGDH